MYDHLSVVPQPRPSDFSVVIAWICASLFDTFLPGNLFIYYEGLGYLCHYLCHFSQDDVIPSSDAEKQGGPICSDITTVAVPVGSSGNGKDCTEEKMPCSLNSRENQVEQSTPCDQKLSHITTSITKRRCSLPSDFLDDLSLPLKKLKEGNLEAATSLAPEQQNILATSSKVMLCVSPSPISENIRINSVKQSMLGDLSSNNSYRGRRIVSHSLQKFLIIHYEHDWEKCVCCVSRGPASLFLVERSHISNVYFISYFI